MILSAKTLPNPAVAFDLLHIAIDLVVDTVYSSEPILKDERLARVRVYRDRRVQLTLRCNERVVSLVHRFGLSWCWQGSLVTNDLKEVRSQLLTSFRELLGIELDRFASHAEQLQCFFVFQSNFRLSSRRNRSFSSSSIGSLENAFERDCFAWILIIHG